MLRPSESQLRSFRVHAPSPAPALSYVPRSRQPSSEHVPSPSPAPLRRHRYRRRCLFRLFSALCWRLVLSVLLVASPAPAPVAALVLVQAPVSALPAVVVVARSIVLSFLFGK